MDPQICLNQMFQAVQDGDLDTAQERMFDLATWIDEGGFYPSLGPPINYIISRRKEMTNGLN